MKESFEHDPRREFDWKADVSSPEKDKIVQHINGEGFYSIKHDESVADVNKRDSVFRSARTFIPEDEKKAILSQLEAHKSQFKDEYNEFVRNDEELNEIEKELIRMGIEVEGFIDKEIEFTDPVARDQFEEMKNTYATLTARNIQIKDKLKALNHTLN